MDGFLAFIAISIIFIQIERGHKRTLQKHMLNDTLSKLIKFFNEAKSNKDITSINYVVKKAISQKQIAESGVTYEFFMRRWYTKKTTELLQTMYIETLELYSNWEHPELKKTITLLKKSIDFPIPDIFYLTS